MNVTELYHFSKWLVEHGKAARGAYQALATVLNHNATQPEKQPVKDLLEALKQTLRDTPLEQLTNEENTLLAHFNIHHFLGAEGVKYVQDTVEMGEFDPATAASDITSAGNLIKNALTLIGAVGTAFANIEFFNKIGDIENDRVTVRIQFKDKASISDVAEWKSWSNEWHDIVRGVALCVNEAPEDTRVIGATNGSIILVLAGTLGFTKVLALISKHLLSVIKDGLEIANLIEDLKHKKILNRKIETVLKERQKEISEYGVKSIVASVKSSLKTEINGEQETALTKGVEKYLKFSKLGGEVDFVAPADEDGTEEADDGLAPQEISQIREIVEEIRSAKAAIKLLTTDIRDDDDDEVE